MGWARMLTQIAGAALSLSFLKFPFGQLLATGILGYALNFRYVGFGKEIPLSLPASRAQSLAATDRVLILSHNVWCHYLQQWFAPSAERRLKGLLQGIADGGYDFVLIQELFLLRVGPFAITDNYELFRAGMQELGYAYSTDPRPSLPFLGQNSGLVIFSKRPFVASADSHDFSVTGEKVCAKGFVHVQASLGNGQTIHLATTHMDSKKKPKGVRGAQTGEISRAVIAGQCVSDKPVPMVIAGDFNVCSRGTKDDGSEYKALKAGLLPLVDIYDTPEIAATRRPNMKPWARGKAKGKEGGAAIDHAFVMGLRVERADTRDFRCTDKRKTVVSDHLGLEFELALLPLAGSRAGSQSQEDMEM